MSNAPLILVVDDEISIRRLIRAALERACYRVREAQTGAEALASANTDDPRVILLDLGLPDRNGLELIPLLRKQSNAAILIVSAREETEEKVAALDLGATDYVTKPFDTEELLARVRAALRHRIENDGGQTSVSIGDLTVDLIGHAVTKAGAEIHLTPKEFAAVAELARYPGRVITHQQLLRTVWPKDYDRHVEYLRVLIRNIRQKIEADPARPQLLINELGVGYRLKGSNL